MGYTLSQLGNVNIGGLITVTCKCIGQYLWVSTQDLGNNSRTIKVFSNTGLSLELVNSLAVSSTAKYFLSDGVNVHVVSADDSIAAYRLVNNVITKIGNSYTTGTVYSCCTDFSNNIFLGVSSGLLALSFNGTNYYCTYNGNAVLGVPQVMYFDGTNIVMGRYYNSYYYIETYRYEGMPTYVDGRNLGNQVGVQTISAIKYNENYIYHSGNNLICTSDISEVGNVYFLGVGYYNLQTSMVTDGYFLYLGTINNGIMAFRIVNNSLVFHGQIAIGSSFGTMTKDFIANRFNYIYAGTPNNIAVLKMALTAQFTVDKRVGIAPLTVNFLAV